MTATITDSKILRIEGETIHAKFSAPFTLEKYQVFLQSKKLPECNLSYDWQTDSYHLQTPARFAHVFGLSGIDLGHGWLPFNPMLFDYQRWIVEDLALPAKRQAVWCDTGLGKCVMMLEIARQVLHKTSGRVLLIVPLNLIQQTLDEVTKFYGADYPEIIRLESRAALKAWCVLPGSGLAIVNPDKFIPRRGDQETISECQWLAGVCLDEASLLKSGGGTIKWALIKSCRGIEYKFTFTATPAPNETMEYASQGSFLEKLRHEGEIIWTFFVRNKDGEWKIKENAREAFYRFLSGWSIYMRNPARYGFQDHLKDLPPPVIKEYRLSPTPEQMDYVRMLPDKTGQMPIFGDSKSEKLEMLDRIRYSEIAKGFLYDGEGPSRKVHRIPSQKPGFVADLAQSEMAKGLKVLIRTEFDEESKIIFDLIKDGQNNGKHVEVFTGSVQKRIVRR